jgi:hypothetical protein
MGGICQLAARIIGASATGSFWRRRRHFFHFLRGRLLYLGALLPDFQALFYERDTGGKNGADKSDENEYGANTRQSSAPPQ